MKQLSQFINEAKATYCGRCGTTHVSPAKGGTCPALKEEDMPWHEDPKNPTRKVGVRKDQYGNVIKNVPKHLAKKAMQTNEEVEDDDGWYTHSQMHGSKKSEKHPKGISAAEWKSGIRWHHGKNKRINIKEEVDQIDEASDEEKARRLALIKFYAKNKTTKVPEGKAKGVLTKGKNQFGSRHIGKFNKYTGKTGTGTLANTASNKAVIGEERDNSIRVAKVLHKGKHVASVHTYRGRAGGWVSQAHNPDGSEATKKYGIDVFDTKREIMKKIKDHHKKVNEEQIDELSKTTLGSYTKKAARSTAGLAANAAARAALHGKASEYDKRTLRNRLTGISKATDRMTKEEVEELGEVSAAKLRDYADKASDARGHRNLPTPKLDKRYKSMALAHEKIRARHAQVAATEETAKTLSQFIKEANDNLFEAEQIKAHHERVKKLKGKKVSFTHPTSKQKITGTMQKIVQMGGLPYAHVETGKSAHRVPVHQID